VTVAGRVIWRGGPDPLTPGDISLLATILGHKWAAVGQAGAFFLNLFGPGLVVAFVAAPAVLGWAAWQKRGGLVSILSLALILAVGYLVTPFTGSLVDLNLGTSTRYALWWADLLLLGVVVVL
jgi:hypothetical protein